MRKTQENKFEFTEGWREVKLGEVSDFQYGLGESSQKKGEFLYIRITDINTDGSLKSSNLTYIGKDKVPSNLVLNKGDILVARTGASFGKSYLFKEDVNSTFGGFLIRLLLDETKIYNYFLFSFMRTKNYWSQANNLVGGGAQPQFNANTICNIKINLPPLTTQKSIAKILSSFDDKIELLREQNETLEKLGQEIFKEWFGKYKIGDDLPDGWRVGKLGDELQTFLGGTPSKSNNNFWQNGTIPWINSGKVNHFRITEPAEMITEEALKKSATKLLQKGTVLIAITGATLGQYSILEIDCCFNQSVVGIKENKKIQSSYIYFWVKNNIKNVIRNATGGAHQHINKENVNQTDFLIPNENILSKYYKIINPIMEKITNNVFEIKTLSNTRNELLPKLMNGKVLVKD